MDHIQLFSLFKYKILILGVATDQNEYYFMDGATFVNYGKTPLITGCNACLNGENMKQGGFTYRTSRLRFVNRFGAVISLDIHAEEYIVNTILSVSCSRCTDRSTRISLCPTVTLICILQYQGAHLVT